MDILSNSNEFNNNTTGNWIKLIYLHLYKDTYLIFMQVYKLLSRISNDSINFEKRENLLFKIKSIY